MYLMIIYLGPQNTLSSKYFKEPKDSLFRCRV